MAPIFTDHMVLQQKTNVPIWGTGRNDQTVQVEFQGQIAKAIVKSGKWLAMLSPLQPGGPFEMIVSTDGQIEYVIRDIMVGEVWLAGGQSNMEQPLMTIEAGLEDALQANHPELRFFTVPRRPFHQAIVPGWHFEGTVSHTAEWETCTPETAKHVTAIGYHFALQLKESLGVPVGIISCNWGGTPIQAWMGEAYLAQDPELAKALDVHRTLISSIDESQYDREYTEYMAAMYHYIEKMDQGIAISRPVQPYGSKSPIRPCGLYETMIRPLIPFALKGVLWYQGESNSNREDILYRKLLAALIHNWRKEWGIPALPFLIVQLPAYSAGKVGNRENWAWLRESQDMVSRHVSHTGLTVALDCGGDDIHPACKKPIGERLSLAARSIAYGQAIDFRGPQLFKYELDHGKVVLSFDAMGGGLAVKDGIVKGFQICGHDYHFIEAEARYIDDRRVEVFSPEVTAPAAVRYAWRNMPEFSLFGRNGLPVSPFRTDRHYE
jgi:sialate O-acetylesterase